MQVEFAKATTTQELAEVQRLRYAVYVTEIGFSNEVEGADDGRFAEPEDEHSWIWYARKDGEVVAATRMTWGGDGFSERQIETYQLQPFLDELPAELMGVGERVTVVSSLRGSGIVDELLARSGHTVREHELRLVFGCCEPHLLPLYLLMGQRTYAERNMNGPAGHFLIPLVSFLPDVESLRGLGAATGPGELPRCVAEVLERDTSARSQLVTPATDFLAEIRHTLERLDAERVSVFDGFTDDETQRCIARSTILTCSPGDRILKRGGVARNIFVVLEGALEVRDGDQIVNVLTPGDVFGELAFLLERPRAFDVDCAAARTRILSLSEGTVRRMIAEDSVVAAKLLLNVSKALCVKLVRTSSLRESD